MWPDWHVGDPLPEETRDGIECTTTRPSGSENLPPPTQVYTVLWAFPYSVIAIDPDQESALADLDRAIVDGRPLQGTDGPHDVHGTLRDMLVDTEIDDLGSHGHRVDPDSPLEYRSVPVLLAAHSGIDERLTVRVEDMGRPGTSAVRSGALAIDLLSTLNRLPGEARSPRGWCPPTTRTAT